MPNLTPPRSIASMSLHCKDLLLLLVLPLLRTFNLSIINLISPIVKSSSLTHRYLDEGAIVERRVTEEWNNGNSSVAQKDRSLDGRDCRHLIPEACNDSQNTILVISHCQCHHGEEREKKQNAVNDLNCKFDLYILWSMIWCDCSYLFIRGL